jgi:threonine aldolase
MSHGGTADFRSDTVTRPTPAMYEAIAKAALGDDVFGDDPTINELQDYAAQLFGKEAALFCATGTQANQVAVHVHCRPGDEVILEQRSHTFYHEQGGLAVLSGVQARTLAGERGRMSLEDIAAAIRPDNDHYPVTRLLVLEQTHNGSGGAVLPLEHLRAAFELARKHGLKVHVDGARVANAAIASGVPLREYGAACDTITCCLSKGLGAPAGTVVMGSRAFVKEARRARKLFGGGMRQVGILGAAGLVALRDMRERLAEDHRRARWLAEGFFELPGLEVVPPETNMVYVRAGGRASAVAQEMRTYGVWVLAIDRDTLRFVTHKDIDDTDIEKAVAAMQEVNRRTMHVGVQGL